MEILPITNATLPEAATLFSQSFKEQRMATPELPAALEDQVYVEKRLGSTFKADSALVALENGRVIGFLCWFLVDNFRRSGRKGAYVPEWGHACLEIGKAKTYRALYRRAAEQWASADCQVHAITLLASDRTAETTWFWNGFGLTVIDAIRLMQPLGIQYSSSLTIRMANQKDVPALTRLDAEHCLHYTRSPIFMPAQSVRSEQENVEFLSRPKNSIWLAETDGELVGLMRFDGYDFDSVAIVESETGILINGAYVRPAFRGQRISVAILDAALRHYQSLGLKYCTVNFETFNPEATTFWMRYFEPVCLSVVRVPESLDAYIELK